MVTLSPSAAMIRIVKTHRRIGRVWTLFTASGGAATGYIINIIGLEFLGSVGSGSISRDIGKGSERLPCLADHTLLTLPMKTGEIRHGQDRRRSAIFMARPNGGLRVCSPRSSLIEVLVIDDSTQLSKPEHRDLWRICKGLYRMLTL